MATRTKAQSSAPGLVDAVVVLRTPDHDHLPTPAQSKKMVTAVLRTAAQETGLKPTSSTVFEHLNSFSVRASSQFVDAIARSKDVAQVLTNDGEVPALIQPVKKRIVEL